MLILLGYVDNLLTALDDGERQGLCGNISTVSISTLASELILTDSDTLTTIFMTTQFKKMQFMLMWDI